MADLSKYPQFMAVLKNDLPELKSWVNSGGNPKEPEPIHGTTLLIQAAYNGHTSILQYLLSLGVSVNETDKYNQTPLMHAALGGKASVMKFLLDHGADIHFFSQNKNTALSIARTHQRIGVVEYLQFYLRQQELEKIKPGEKGILEPKTENYLRIITDVVEYYGVMDRVERFFNESDGRKLRVKSIMKIEGGDHWKRHVDFKKTMINPDRVVQKFYGNTLKNINQVIQTGFTASTIISPKILGKYGKGIYFTTDASKSAQYTSSDSYILLCEVAIGKFWTVHCGMDHLDFTEVRKCGYDSVYAPRGTLEKGGVEFDEFILYHPDQAVPLYIIEFSI